MLTKYVYAINIFKHMNYIFSINQGTLKDLWDRLFSSPLLFLLSESLSPFLLSSPTSQFLLCVPIFRFLLPSPGRL